MTEGHCGYGTNSELLLNNEMADECGLKHFTHSTSNGLLHWCSNVLLGRGTMVHLTKGEKEEEGEGQGRGR